MNISNQNIDNSVKNSLIKQDLDLIFSDFEEFSFTRLYSLSTNELISKGEICHIYDDKKESKLGSLNKLIFDIIETKKKHSIHTLYLEVFENKITNFNYSLKPMTLSEISLNPEIENVINLYFKILNSNIHKQSMTQAVECTAKILLTFSLKEAIEAIKYIKIKENKELLFNDFDVLEEFTSLIDDNSDFFKNNTSSYVLDNVVFNYPVKFKSFKKHKTTNKFCFETLFNELKTLQEIPFAKIFNYPGKTSSQEHLSPAFKLDLINMKKYNARLLKTVSNEKIYNLNKLKEQFPNFSEFLQHIEQEFIINSLSDNTIYIPPTLLSGSPGIGKTFMLNKLSKALDIPSYFLNLGTVTGGFILNGLHHGWGSGQPGFISKCLFESQFANPLIILDELDKVDNSNSFHNVTPVLLSLLERHTSAEFRDEFLEFNIDASHLNSLATANDLNNISEPVLNRFSIFEINNPNYEERQIFARSVFEQIITERNVSHLTGPLSSEVVQTLVKDESSLRDIKRILTTTISNSLKRKPGFIDLIPEDIANIYKKAKPIIGFR